MQAALVVLLLLQQPDDASEARANYDQAKQFFEDGDYVAAAVMFEQAQQRYARVTSPEAHKRRRSALSNEATSYSQANQPIEAVSAFARLRDAFAAEMTADERAQVDDAIKKLQAQIGTVRLSGIPDGADVRVDGRAAPKREFQLGAGDHSIEVQAATYKPYLDHFVVAGQQQVTVEVKLESLKAPARLRVESSVGGSNVFVDGRKLGKAPVETSLGNGVHHYEVTAETYTPQRGEIEAHPGEEALLRVDLTRKRGAIGLRIEPYFITQFPFRTDTPFGEYTNGGGLRLFPEWLRFSSFQLGAAFEYYGRDVNQLSIGGIATWCPDTLSWFDRFLYWCPGNFSVLFDFGPGDAMYESGLGTLRGTTDLELRPGARTFVRMGLGLEIEVYNRRPGISGLWLWGSALELAIGVDL